jgi:hypothetical protein
MIGQLLKFQLGSLHCHHHAAAVPHSQPQPTSQLNSSTPTIALIRWYLGEPHASRNSALSPSLSLECASSLARPIVHMMATTYTSPVYTYQFKITNSTPKEQTYIIKPPNMPSPVPLPADRVFPALYTCTLAPSASQIFTTEIPSNSQGIHFSPQTSPPMAQYTSVFTLR